MSCSPLLQKNGKKISELLFLIPLSCMFLLSYLTYWNLTSNTEIVGYYAYIEFFNLWRSFKPFFLTTILIKTTFFSDYSRKQLAGIGTILSLIFLLCKYYHPNYYLVYAVAFCLAAKGISYRLISKTYLYLSIVTLLMTLIAFAYGITDDFLVNRVQIVRHSLGLVHPNSLGMWCLMILTYYFQYKQHSLRNKDFILLLVFSVIIFLITNSRASFILCIFALLTTWYLHSKNSLSTYKWFSLLALLISLALALSWILLCANYRSDIQIYRLLNLAFSDRINLSHQALNDYPPSLMGNNIRFPYHVDSLFTYTLVIYGYSGLAIFLSLFYTGAVRAYKKNLPFVLLAVLVFQLYNTQENVFLYHLFDLTMFTATCSLDDV